MSTLSSDGTYVIVEKGDTLWGIAEEHLGAGIKYKQLASINNLVNPDLIHTGQKIYLYDSGSGGGSSTAVSSNSNTVTLYGPHLLSTEEDTLYITWDWGRTSETEKYKVAWTYKTDNGVRWVGNNHEITVDQHLEYASRQDTFKIPNGATVVYVKVKPISKTKKEGDTETVYFTADWCSEGNGYKVAEKAPDPSGTINITLTGLSLKAELTGIDLEDGATKVEFQLVKNNTSQVDLKELTIDTAFNYVTHTWTVVNDSKYKVRYRFVKGAIKGDWSDYSNEVTTAPIAPDGIKDLRALSESSVYLEWNAVSTATGYEAEYTTDVTYFDSSPDNVQSKSVDSKVTHMEITDMASGDEYFFRLRALGQGDSDASEWTEIKSITIGTVPVAPTTWSSATTVIVGEPLTLYWAHNCEDGSKWRYAELRLYVDGTLIQPDETIENPDTEEDEDTVGSYVFDTSDYPEGTKIDWQIRTMGIVSEYGEWSTPRTIDIYAQPTIDLSVIDTDGEMIDTLTGFPLYIEALAGPSTQAPLSYHLSVIANETYETVDALGNDKLVSQGEEVYSKHFDMNANPLMVEISANNIDLENNIRYTVVCTAAMNSGLTAEARKEFNVSWVEVGHLPNAAIGINYDNYTAQIRPYCENRTRAYHKVSRYEYTYTVTDEVLSGVYGASVQGAVTTTGEQVYEGTFPDGTTGYYCTVETRTMVEGVTLAVYRREFDGSFVKIASGIENVQNTFVTDPHPALDYARYRIVATTTSTGTVAFYDVPGQEVKCNSVIIQWNEDWTSFDATTDDAPAQKPWSGSLLKIPYNIDVSDTNNPDVELVEYVGRKNPISYYGTHIGQTSTWNVDIPKSDKETLYALRRLSVWMGDVYVREPSGSGYWANIKVSYNQKHTDVTIPVTFAITRVEGGV